MPWTDDLRPADFGGAARRATAHEMVRDTLRLAILSGRLKPGIHLVQAELAVWLDVSTTPVREALRDLLAEGLVRFDAHRGAVVHELDVKELSDVYEIRKVLEPLAIRLAAERISAEQLALATEQQAQLDSVKDAGEWVLGNLRFHETLEQASGSPRLASLVRSVQNTASLYVARSVELDPRRIRQGNEEHRRILAAVAKGDGDRAAALLRSHLDATLRALVKDDSLPRQMLTHSGSD